MANPPTLSQSLDTVWTAHARKVIQAKPRDQFYVITPTLDHFRAKGQPYSGGTRIVVNVKQAIEPVGGSYYKAQAVSLTAVDPVTEAGYDVCFYEEPIVLYHQDMVRAGGPEATFDYVAEQTEDAKLRLERKMATAIFAASPTAGKDLIGLPKAIEDTPASSGVYGGLDGAASSQPGWRNKATTSLGSFASGGLDAMDSMITSLMESETGKPSLIVTTATVFNYYKKAVRGHYSYVTPSPGAGQNGDLGFERLSHNGIPITWDPYCTSGAMYFLNNDAAHLREVAGGAFTLYGDGFASAHVNGVMAKVAIMRWEGQFVTLERRALGKITGITA